MGTMLSTRVWPLLVLAMMMAGCAGSEVAQREPSTSQATVVTPATTAVVAVPTTSGSPVAAPTAPPTSETTPVESNPASWPLRQKLAQMLFPGFNAGPGDSSTDPAMIQALIDAGAGGVFIGRKEEALFDSAVMTNARANTLPPFVATDGEGGQVDLLPSIMEPLPPARGDGLPGDADRIRSTGAARGTNLAQRGCHG
jgi:beta-N-acetylhexosaminidase